MWDFWNWHLVKRKPSIGYLYQGGVDHCGIYTLKTILSSFNLAHKEIKEHIGSDFLARTLGGLTPTSLKNKLEEGGLKARILHPKKTDNKVLFLINELKKKEPVILLVENKINKKTQKFEENHPLRKVEKLHWISIWGYNAKKKIFYVYDSAVPPSKIDKVPRGNKIRTFEEITNMWNATNTFRNVPFLKVGNTMISVKNPANS